MKNTINNLQVKKRFASLQSALSIEAPKFHQIGYLLDNDIQYKKYLKILSKQHLNIQNLSIFSVITDLLNKYKSYEDDFSKLTEFTENVQTGTHKLSKSATEIKAQNLLNTTLINLCNSLLEVGCIDTLIYNHSKKKCRKYGVSVLEISEEDLKEQFHNYSHLNLVESYALNSFWVNKFIKFINTIEEASLYELSTMYMDKSSISSDDKNRLLYISQKKKKFLCNIYSNSYNEEHSNAFIQHYKSKYSDILKDTFYGEYANNLEQEYKILQSFENMKSNLYYAKDLYTNALLNELLIDFKNRGCLSSIRNWGITKDTICPDKYILGVHLLNQLFPCTMPIPEKSIMQTMQYLGIKELNVPNYDICDYFSTDEGLFPFNIMYAPILSSSTTFTNKISNACKSNPNSSILNNINTHLHRGTYIDTKNRTHIKLSNLPNPENEPDL